MKSKNFTIGMAGHIDHGKTSLTKALTNIDTDRLKEEKERKISIELGFAPLKVEGRNLHLSIIDVPGHEKFIRQMIAGVAGIDLVLIVIALDEGIMPQTEEHINILSLLNIHNAIIVLTKMDRADEELIEIVYDDVKRFIKDTPYRDAPIVQVDSIKGTGIKQLKDTIMEKLQTVSNRNDKGQFRMPIDQVFSLKGIGTVVRGTIYEGKVDIEEGLFVLPSGKQTKARQLQVHSQPVVSAFAGQRAAIQLSGLHKSMIKRGDVLVRNPQYFTETDIIDVALTLIPTISSPIKQRSPIKLHTGATEVYGHIVFFDRNNVHQESNEIMCQIRLKEKIVVNRGDRFILRRATPVETLGGGWIINPSGEKYKFHEKTIQMLLKHKEGSPSEQIFQLLSEIPWIKTEDFVKKLAFDRETIDQLLHDLEINNSIVKVNQAYATKETVHLINEKMKQILEDYHQLHPLRLGMNKPEFLQQLEVPKSILEALMKIQIDENIIIQRDQYIRLANFTPHFPSQWKKRMEAIVDKIDKDEINVKEWNEYLSIEKIQNPLGEELKQFLIAQQIIYPLMPKYVIHANTVHKMAKTLMNQTSEQFSIKDAKEIWGLSRKNLIPLLELLDELQYTKRMEGIRIWMSGLKN